MFHSLFSIFRQSPSQPPKQQVAEEQYIPDTKYVLDKDHDDYISIDIKTMSYVEIAQLKMPELVSKVPMPIELERTISNSSVNNHNHLPKSSLLLDNSEIPYSDAIVDDLHFNDKRNRSKKKRVHIKRNKH